jgi:HAD superfamily hydrolase (TIGR01509 family)
MGGDQFVAAVTDEATDRRIGDAVRDAQGRHYAAAIDEVSLMPGARDLLAELRGRGDTIVLASSAKPEEAGHYLDLLGARELVDAWTTAADVSASKPAPDLVHEALDRVGGQSADAVMIGDSPWDVRAAKQAGVITVAVLTGGFGAEELREAGAIAVFRSVVELCEAVRIMPESGLTGAAPPAVSVRAPWPRRSERSRRADCRAGHRPPS